MAGAALLLPGRRTAGSDGSVRPRPIPSERRPAQTQPARLTLLGSRREDAPPLGRGGASLGISGESGVRQPIWVPVADSASVTGWKNVSPPEVQSPLPPEVRPIALLPEKSEPPLSPGSAHTSVWMSPLTVPCE